MKRPDQKFFIREDGTLYAFDGVIKLETTHSLKIAEQASDVNAKKAVNYAIKQPIKVSAEVIVSDTVTVADEPLTSGGGLRSIAAHRALVAMQERRNLLELLTPTFTLKNMMIESIAEELSVEYQNEFHATISFKEMTVKKKKQQITETKADETGESNKSVIQTILGWVGLGGGK